MTNPTQRDDGGPAFPDISAPGGPKGMSLWDYFAGQALAGMCQACGWQGGDFKAMAKHAAQAADEMIAARKPPQPESEG